MRFIYDFSFGYFRNLRKVYLASANFKFMQGPLHMNEKEEMRPAPQQYNGTSGVSTCVYE
jgi:hypothetical protein